MRSSPGRSSLPARRSYRCRSRILHMPCMSRTLREIWDSAEALAVVGPGGVELGQDRVEAARSLTRISHHRVPERIRSDLGWHEIRPVETERVVGERGIDDLRLSLLERVVQR